MDWQHTGRSRLHVARGAACPARAPVRRRQKRSDSRSIPGAASGGMPTGHARNIVGAAPGNVTSVRTLRAAISTSRQPPLSCTRMRPPAGDHHGSAAGSSSVHEKSAFPGCATSQIVKPCVVRSNKREPSGENERSSRPLTSPSKRVDPPSVSSLSPTADCAPDDR